MPPTIATAPGKIILFGEHAVVYSRPAIAAPVTQLRATARVEDTTERGVRLCALDLNREYWLADARDDDPFSRAVLSVAQTANLEDLPDIKITVSSSIPIASGLGSGAAMAAAVIRALALHLGLDNLATDEAVADLTYKVEKLLHGTPSGIDNTVVAYEKPVYFIRQRPKNWIETLKVARPCHLLVADTGMFSITKDVVGDVRRQWQENPGRFERIFDDCGQVAESARHSMELGEIDQLGKLMTQNQRFLEEMTVSSPELERLVEAAVAAGALGAKLSGAGRGGNMIALVREEDEEPVRLALSMAGARVVFKSVLT